MSATASRPDGTQVTLEVFTQRRHRCPTCRRSWSSATLARKHVKEGCRKDPANRGCKTCRHYVEGYDASWEEPGCPDRCDKGHEIDAPDWPMHCPDWEAATWVRRAGEPTP